MACGRSFGLRVLWSKAYQRSFVCRGSTHMVFACTSTVFAKDMGSVAQHPPSTPRTFPQTGFTEIGNAQLIEEETLPEYNADHFYPVHMGQVFGDRFQVVTKLGYGSSSTIWLARDLQNRQYVALKVYIHNSTKQREMPFYDLLKETRPSSHIGAKNIRKLLDSFAVDGPKGKHIVLALQISQMSLRDMDTVFMGGDGFEVEFVKGAIRELLEALDFLHTEMQVVHTDVHPGNLLLGADDSAIFAQMERSEMSDPVARKPLKDRHIYLSRLMKPKAGPLLLSDFGEVRIGPGPHAGDIMPIMYRAPETLLHIQWSFPVDIWSVGLTAWDLRLGRTLFSARKPDGSFSDGVHFAELIAALGPPPLALLQRHKQRASEYWDDQGAWENFVPIPEGGTLELKASKLADKNAFLHFIKRALAWDPNDRPSARELLSDPWLAE